MTREPNTAQADVVFSQLLGLFDPGQARGLPPNILEALAPGMVLLVLRRDPELRLPAQVRRSFQALVAELGLGAGATVEALEAAVQAYYQPRPHWAAPLTLLAEMVGVDRQAPLTSRHRAAVARALIGAVPPQ
ncbi:MAG: hypothetical protein IPG45_19470 [Deltaproteobacteria bacterium]|nr:hypothetical protein [Deltaproteobacteria bacterium]